MIDKEEYFLHENVSLHFQKLIANKVVEPSKDLRLLAVNRANANTRKIVNMYMIHEFIDPEINITMVQDVLQLGSPKKQIETFRNANVLIAAHGAQLINMLFLPRCSIVIELQQWGYFDTVFAKMAVNYGLIYGYIYNRIQYNTKYRKLAFKCVNHHADVRHIERVQMRKFDFHVNFTNINAILGDLNEQRQKCLKYDQNLEEKEKMRKKILKKLAKIDQFYKGMGIWLPVESHISLYSDLRFKH